MVWCDSVYNGIQHILEFVDDVVYLKVVTQSSRRLERHTDTNIYRFCANVCKQWEKINQISVDLCGFMQIYNMQQKTKKFRHFVSAEKLP